MIFFVIFFLLVLYHKLPNGSIARIFPILYLTSLCANFFIGTEIIGTNFLSETLYCIWVILILSFLIFPWRNYKKIEHIDNVDQKRLKRFVLIVGSICAFMTIGCGIIAYFINRTVENIDVFKYAGGQEEIYAELGVSMKPYLLAYILYPISYLFIPIFLYYLSIHKIYLGLWCLLCSLASVAFGLAYFSRSHTVQYAMLSLVIFWLYRGIFTPKTLRRIKSIGLIVICSFAVSFIAISISRFDGHVYEGQKKDAVIKDTMLYSLADYFGMWWYEGRTVADQYNLEGFNGKIAFQGVDRFLNMVSFGHVKSYSKELQMKRERLLHEHAGTFIGVSAYFLYDLGLFFSLAILVMYFNYVTKISPRKSRTSLDNTMQTTMLIQLPLFGIFYSTLDIVILLLFYWLFLRQFFNGRKKIKL